jgi:dihydrodipicolinate synthase/N-acetylneuraminate lyase
MDTRKKLYGVVPPMITPFTETGELDIPSLEALVEYLSVNVDGLFICGSYGSGPLMSVRERKTVAETVLRRAAGRIPVVVHTGTANSRDAADLSAHASSIGAAAVSAVAPFYYHHNAESVLAFYRAILGAVPKDYPVYIYHNPKFSGYEISPDTIKRLRDDGCRGVKDATFDIMKFAAYMRELGRDGFDVVLGTESMWLSARALGAEAYIPGLASAYPEICVAMHRQGMADDYAACRETQFTVNKIRDIMYLAKSTQLAVYTMLELRGIVTAHPRSPFLPAAAAEKESIARALKDMGML